MDKANDLGGTETCVDGRLWRAARTASLLAGAGLSCVLMVNLPTTLISQTNSQATAAQPIVKASDKWITLGTEPSDGQTLPGTSPIERTAARTVESEQRRPRLKPSAIQRASHGREIAPSDRAGPNLSRRGERLKAVQASGASGTKGSMVGSSTRRSSSARASASRLLSSAATVSRSRLSSSSVMYGVMAHRPTTRLL